MSTVLSHISTTTVHPQNRCVASKVLCRLWRLLGRACTTITTIRVATSVGMTRDATDAEPVATAWTSSATYVRYQSVPASDVPTCSPPKW